VSCKLQEVFMTPHCLTELGGRVLAHAILANLGRHLFCFASLAVLPVAADGNSAPLPRGRQLLLVCVCSLSHLRWYENCGTSLRSELWKTLWTSRD